MDTTKKKVGRRTSPIESSQEEVAINKSATTEAKPKKTKTTTKKKTTAPSSQEVVMETESEVETSTTTTTTTSATTSSQTNGTPSPSIQSIPTTPISKYIPSLSQMGTPLSPNRAAQRLREKDELSLIHQRLKSSLKKLESTEIELEKKNQELEEIDQKHTLTINKLKQRSDQFERQLLEEQNQNSDLTSNFNILDNELKTKESSWKKEKDEMLSKFQESINKLNQENSLVQSQLKADIVTKEYEIEGLKTEINRLKDDLQYRVREGEDKSRKLLENEYSRFKIKEDEYHQLISSKDDEIKKIKLELKEKEKSSNAMNKKENELNNLIQAHERQIEDIRDSINREWELKAAQMMEEHHSRTIHLQQAVDSFNEEKERIKSQMDTLNGQIEDLNIKNNEYEDKVKEMNVLLSQKDNSIGELSVEIEELKKKLRKQLADLKSKDGQISLLQIEINTKDNKCNTLQTETNRLKSELYSITNQIDPEIPLDPEINSLKELVKGFEKTVDDRKRKRSKLQHEFNAVANQDQNGMIVEETLQTTSTTTSSDNGSSASHLNNIDSSNLPTGPEQSELFNPGTVSFSLIDSTQEFIRLSVHGDMDEGLSISKWRLIVVKPDGSKAGFSFPDGIQPFKGIKSVTVWTGRQRPQGTPTENEFYWSRQELWTSPVEGTIVKLVSPSEETTTVTLPVDGIYQKPSASGKSNCLIM
ncbi:hypothetical protein RB653_008923 [Dictyostelium firmibasis]|uniref:LTD domain-containing protein n=1 Tax=Dictyostelium firmibasis TaxID=79012 RepID=A0AAN7UDF3_9MYCE